MPYLKEGERWALIHGDCLSILPTLEDKSVAHVITDPPYGSAIYERARTVPGAIGRPNDVTARLELSSRAIGSIDEILAPVAKEILRLTARWMLIFSDAESASDWRRELGATYIRFGIWVKTDAMPQFSGDRPGQGFEAMTIAHRKGRKRWNGGGRAAVWHSNRCGNDRQERPDHPCPKPLELMLDLVSDFTDPDDIVLDPFAGSGTTGVACLRLGRRFIGIEKDEKYAAIARERLTAETQGLSLRDARHGQIGLFGS